VIAVQINSPRSFCTARIGCGNKPASDPYASLLYVTNTHVVTACLKIACRTAKHRMQFLTNWSIDPSLPGFSVRRTHAHQSLQGTSHALAAQEASCNSTRSAPYPDHVPAPLRIQHRPPLDQVYCPQSTQEALFKPSRLTSPPLTKLTPSEVKQLEARLAQFIEYLFALGSANVQ